MRLLLISFLLCLASAGIAQPMGGFQMPANNATYKDVNYAGDDLEAHRMDIYLPTKTTQPTSKVIVVIYGSAWFSNNMKQMAYMSIGKPLTDAGFAVVCINHRSSGDAKFPAQIHDVKAAIRFLRAHADEYKLDTSFIGITGFSSGGHLSSLAGVTNNMKKRKVGKTTMDLEGTVGGNLDQSSSVDAVVDWFGPVDMARMNNCETVNDEKSPEAAFIGGAPAKNPDLVALISPISYVTKDAKLPRFLVFHGDADNVVPHCQGVFFSEELDKAGVLERFVSVPGGGHGPVTFNENTFHQMTTFFQKEAGIIRQRVLEDGGTGAFKAVMTEDPSLPEHTILVPQDLAPFGPKNRMPVLVWGNGACANSPFEHVNFLNEIASHGYIVLATGVIPMTDEWYRGPMSRSEQQIESIDWIIAQNADPSSPYYQKIDTQNICVAGMSCGGLQTLFNCADPRIRTLMICNSGLFNQQNAGQAVGGMPMPPKEKLNEIHTPIIYILGGKEDIAYENGMDDFHRIEHVPACAANYPVGHGGTYREPHGGEFTVVALAWLDWQLKGDRKAASMFRGKDCGLSKRKDWTIEKNQRFDHPVECDSMLIKAALSPSATVPAASPAGSAASVSVPAASPAAPQVNLPLFQTKYTADPSPLVVGDTLFLYTSHDAHPEDIPDENEKSSAGFFMYDWLLWSTTDMVNWTEHGAVASLKDFPWRSRENGAWAIQTVERNGKYYLYAPLHGHGIGVLVADSPYGPFRDPLGEPLVWQKEHWNDIDPSVYTDDDGQAYLYWGNPHCYYALLNDDMVSIKKGATAPDASPTGITQLPHIENYQEGPWFYKRDGKYYLAFASTCCPEALGYAMSDKPTGPWTSVGYIMRPTERDRGNHPGICDFKGHTYVFGQNYDLMHIETLTHHERRSVSATEIKYNADGTIQEVPYWLDQRPLQQLQWLNPYKRVEAETMNWGYGLKTAKMGIPNTGVVADMPESTGRKNMYVYDVNNGEYIRLRGVDFGSQGPTAFSVAAAAAGSGNVTLRLDSQEGPVVGTVAIKKTGKVEKYKTFTTKLAPQSATGVHDLYICFDNVNGDVRLDWWQFAQ
jgi:acetyl esterase/lipase